jgi:NAD(P)-dependent dehydrogenase (short-subunit alcohol dehydrogenase family)
VTRLALVTGGSRGVGACVVTQLQAAGWDVLAPGRAELDFDCEESVLDYCAWTAARGICRDAIVFCHGEWYSRESQYMQHYEEQYRSRVIYPHWIMRSQINNLQLRYQDCAVVMVASTRGFIGGIDTGPYSAACAAQIALMLGYAREFKGGPGKARFNCVAPGLTETDMGQIVKATGGAKPGTVGQPPEAVAAAIVGLVTDGASNGRVVRVVDGVAADAKWVWA